VDLQWDPGEGTDGLRKALETLGLTVTSAERSLPKHRLGRRA
jgi:hypothetical protein